MIHNIIYGDGIWINGTNAIYINKTMNQNVNISGNLDVEGNVTYYGGAYNFSENGFTYVITNSGYYYNMTNMSASYMRGMNFTANNRQNGGSYFTIIKEGLYQVNFGMSAQFGNNGEYGFGVQRNFQNIEQYTYKCYIRLIGTGRTEPIYGSCLLYLDYNDKINLAIDDEQAPAQSIIIKNLQLNLIRIGG